MISSTGSEARGFALEVMYNYGKTAYARGNGLVALRISDPGLACKARAEQWHAANDGNADGGDDDDDGGLLTDPDGHVLDFVDVAFEDRFLAVALRVTNLPTALDYYATALGASVLPGKDATRRTVGFGGTGVELVHVATGALEHGESQGRFAVQTEDWGPDVVAGKALVVKGPLALPPHMERVVVVADSDGHEFAFVEARGYARCIEAGEPRVDWATREEKITRQRSWNRA